jgi:RNA polymerase sigma factor for flagellar operon FliA
MSTQNCADDAQATDNQPADNQPADDQPTTNAPPSTHQVAQMTPEQVVAEYAGLVLDTGQQLIQQLQCPVDLDDLAGWGYQGLLEAFQRFDPDMDVTFASFAFYRIRGAMYDGLRSTGWAVRGTAIQVRDTMAINEYLESNLMANASMPQNKTFADSVNYLDRMVGDCVTICLVQNHHLELVASIERPTQADDAARREIARALTAAMRQLSDNERTVMVRYHVEDEAMSDIAQDMGYSKSWVSRINARALDKVRKILFEQGDHWDLYMIRG